MGAPRILDVYNRPTRQKSDCSCGPASFSLVAAALGLGEIPETSWWDGAHARWLRVEELPSRGMALHEAATALELTLGERAEISSHRAFPENKTLLERHLLLATTQPNLALIANFAQDPLLDRNEHPQGNPHYSPVAAYDRANRRALIADVDADVKEAYWATLDALFDAMAFQNPAYRLPRGWLLVRKR
ncbi:MAG: hypothetical protein HY075_14145 [Deltaproteobacteria bacterium]|nr:hypothetical protein [Deltaproteobacteria bacterium]